MSPPSPNKPFVIDQAHLRRARNLARESGRSVIAELEHLHNGTSTELVQQLASLFGMMALDRDGLRALTPAFDLLPLGLARRWRCLLLREPDGTLLGVLADPFDPDLQLWLNSQARGAVLMRLTGSADLQRYLATHAGDEPPGVSVEPGVFDPDGQASKGVMEATREILQRAMRR